MEKVRRVYNNDMYRYTSRGSTLYDFLGGYLDLYDYSPAAIFNSIRRDMNIQQNSVNEFNMNTFKGIADLYKQSIQGKIVDSMLHRMTKQDKDELLKKLQSVNPELYSFPGILEYLGFLEDANFTQRALEYRGDDRSRPELNRDIDELNTILIDTAVEKADPELVQTVRRTIMQAMFIPYVRRLVNKEPDGPEKQEHLDKLKLLQSIYHSQESVQEYDDAISFSQMREEEAMLKARREVEFRFKRLSAISNLTGRPMPELLGFKDGGDGSFTELVSKPDPLPQEPYEPRQGDYRWSFRPMKRPMVVFNGPVEFSENGEENQEIMVVRYGDFMYGKSAGVTTYEDVPLELVGVTVLGNDQNLNYFVFTPTENLRNLQNGINLEYYKKLLFSPFVLDDTVGARCRYLPVLDINEDGDAVLDYDGEMSLIDLNPQEALKYASVFEGSVGRGMGPMTIQDYCNSPTLFNMQMDVLRRTKIQERDKLGGVREDY